MVKKHFSAMILIVLMVTSHTSIAADPDAGKQKAQLCAACHGPDGNSTNPAWPSRIPNTSSSSSAISNPGQGKMHR